MMYYGEDGYLYSSFEGYAEIFHVRVAILLVFVA